MQPARYALALASAFLIVSAPAHAATAALITAHGAEAWQRQRTVGHKASQPSSDALLRQMLNAADAWWTAQGSAPPCSGRADVQWGTVDGVHQGFGYYNSCTVVLGPHWWATQYAFITGRHSLRMRRRIAVAALVLLIHERGHNIGYGHIPGTVMQAEVPVVPGWCYTWAAVAIS